MREPVLVTTDIVIDHMLLEVTANADLGDFREDLGSRWKNIVRKEIGRGLDKPPAPLPGESADKRQIDIKGTKHVVYQMPEAVLPTLHFADDERALVESARAPERSTALRNVMHIHRGQ